MGQAARVKPTDRYPRRVCHTVIAPVTADGRVFETIRNSLPRVDEAVEHALHYLIGVYGLCDLISVSTAPFLLDKDWWLAVTVVADRLEVVEEASP